MSQKQKVVIGVHFGYDNIYLSYKNPTTSKLVQNAENFEYSIGGKKTKNIKQYIGQIYQNDFIKKDIISYLDQQLKDNDTGAEIIEENDMIEIKCDSTKISIQQIYFNLYTKLDTLFKDINPKPNKMILSVPYTYGLKDIEKINDTFKKKASTIKTIEEIEEIEAIIKSGELTNQNTIVIDISNTRLQIAQIIKKEEGNYSIEKRITEDLFGFCTIKNCLYDEFVDYLESQQIFITETTKIEQLINLVEKESETALVDYDNPQERNKSKSVINTLSAFLDNNIVKQEKEKNEDLKNIVTLANDLKNELNVTGARLSQNWNKLINSVETQIKKFEQHNSQQTINPK